jgi:protoporphyrin/coproporphyrin ferrochelatase
MNRSKIGVLLINLGTPDNCDPKSVYTYLKQFLNDPRVIDLPTVIRYFLVNWVIIPFRYKQSAHAYQEIWGTKGSPLLTNSQDLVSAVQKEFDSSVQIELGMRYGNPSIESAFNALKDCQKIIAIPLFPQYSSAATGSATEELLRVLGAQWNIPEISVKRDFFNNAHFIAAYARIIKEHLNNKKIDTLIFSFHGLPERHIDKSACHSACSRAESCPKPDQLNTFCYRAQCYETSRLIAKQLELSPSKYVVSFQSRLGKTPWVKPYTDLVLEDLRQKKVEHIAIVCPSFVADCLETLEEINIRARAQWLELGGGDFVFIPCLNSHPIWVKGLINMIKSQAVGN